MEENLALVLIGGLLAIPAAAVALAVAAATWRFVAPEGRSLADLVHEEDHPDAELPRMGTLAGALAAAGGAFALGFAVVLPVAAREDPLQPHLPTLALAPPAGLALALLVLLLWPSRPALGPQPARSDPVRLASSVPGWLRAALLAGAGVLGPGLFLTGLLGVRDPASGEQLALGVPSVMSWRTRGDEVVGVEYTAYGVTVPWPGWAWGLPTLAGFAVCAALLTSVVAHLTRRAGPLASARDAVDAAMRRHVAVFIGFLVLTALAGSLGGSLLLAGTTLQSVSLIPLPSPDGLNIHQEPGYAQPTHAIATAMTWLGAGLLAAVAVIPWWGLLLIRELRRAERAARTIF